MKLEQLENSSKGEPKYLFRSGLLGSIVIYVGSILSDPNKSSPDWEFSMFLGLILSPWTLAFLGIGIVLVLRFIFQPLVLFLRRRQINKIAAAGGALLAVLIGLSGVAALIDGANVGHVVSVVVALTISCLVYGRKNQFV